MDISFSRPKFLWLLLLVIIFFIYILRKCKATKKVANFFINKNSSNFANYTADQIYIKLLLRNICRCIAYICIVLALAGISWGSVSTPTQKNGRACAFVFDISYSMTATDAPNSLSRLDASSKYAKMLLNYMQGISVSCVLAKGDGIVAIPQTEDFSSIYSLLDILSPTMMSAKGSSLGKGIDAAFNSFPSSYSKSSLIIVFTDGDETDSALLNSLSKVVRSGVDVCIIGFGSERESEVVAGDGITRVKTALREKKLKEICSEVNKKNQMGKDFSLIKTSHVNFVDASEVGSAIKVIYEIKNITPENGYLPIDKISNNPQDVQNAFAVSYEVKSVDRHILFILLSILFLLLSVIVSDLSFKKLKNSSTILLLFCSPFLFSSCNTNLSEVKLIFESTWNWYKKDYNKAISGFTETINMAEQNNDELSKQYALYGLSVTYLMQNEKNASLEKLEQISPDAPIKIKFASYYNAGIIAQREGDYEKAISLFKLALLILPDDVNAKINLELSLAQENQKVKDGKQEMLPSSESDNTESQMEKSIFNRMKENDRKQWKNYDVPDKNNSVIDY